MEPPGKPLSESEIHVIKPKTAARLEEMPQSKNKLKVEPLKKMEQDQ